MAAPQGDSTNGRAPSEAVRAGAQSELEHLRATCRRQATVIDALRGGSPPHPAAGDTELTEVRLRLDARAPGAARAIVADRLRDRLPGPAFDRAQLVASELMSNGVLHSEPSADAVLVFRLEVSPAAVRLEVEDPGHRGAVAPRPPDLDRGGGFGLNLVQRLSERWGLERIATGGTRVWAQIAPGPPLPSTTS